MAAISAFSVLSALPGGRHGRNYGSNRFDRLCRQGIGGSYLNLQIFVRARDLRHSLALTRDGATSVVPEALEASIQLAGIVLRAVSTSLETIDTVEQEFWRDDYLALEKI